jgi:DNA-binding transcriptional ArsR family regulator
MLKSQAVDRIFRALGDPTRRFIVEALCDGEQSVTQLSEPLPLQLPTILQHLKVLEESGLIRTQKMGQERLCSIEPQALRLLDEWLTWRRSVWDPRLVELSTLVRSRG